MKGWTSTGAHLQGEVHALSSLLGVGIACCSAFTLSLSGTFCCLIWSEGCSLLSGILPNHQHVL